MKKRGNKIQRSVVFYRQNQIVQGFLAVNFFNFYLKSTVLILLSYACNKRIKKEHRQRQNA